MILAALAMVASGPAMMVIMNGSQTTTIPYSSMKRCLTAKAELERQYQDSYNRDLERGIMRSPPVVFCVPK